jgi:hypothetical protein
VTTTYTDLGLEGGTAYAYRVQAMNGNSVPTAYSNVVSVLTLGSRSAPRAPTGLWMERTTAGGSNFNVTFHWHEATKRVDGTVMTGVSYEVYQSPSLFAPRTSWTLVSTVTTNSYATTAVAGTVTYYTFRTIDNAGFTSDFTEIMDDSQSGNHIFMAADNVTRLTLPDHAATVLRFEHNNYGSDLMITLDEVESEEVGRVVKSVQMIVLNAESGANVTDLVFNPPVLHGTIHFTVENGQVMQGSPRPGAARAPVIDAAQAAQQLSLFWHNGNEWVKTNGMVNAADQTVSFTGGRAGRYQIRAASRISGLTLTRVYPRIITPNGDTWNDKAIFQFDNPDLLPLSGKIFDITGTNVADLAIGPNPDSTLTWDGRDSGGRVVPAGIYLYQISLNGQTLTGTVVVAR